MQFGRIKVRLQVLAAIGVLGVVALTAIVLLKENGENIALLCVGGIIAFGTKLIEVEEQSDD